MSSTDAALGIVIEEGRGGPAPTTGEVRETRAILSRAVWLRFWDVLLSCAWLTAQTIQFAPTWYDSCDFQIKMWATVWISGSTVRSLLMLVAGYRLLVGARVLKSFRVLQFLLELFSYAWFLYGISALFVNRPNGEWCNVVSKRWALAGWSLQAISILLPCALVCVCVPCLLCALSIPTVRERLLPLLFSVGPPSTNQVPTPDETLAKLHKTTFRAAVRAGLIDVDVSGGGTSAAAADDLVARSLISHALPGPFGAVAQMVARLNSATEPNRPTDPSARVAGAVSEGVPPSAAGADALLASSAESAPPVPASRVEGSHQHPAGAGERLPTLTCPICVTEFAGDDEILLLPCDPRRHVFHTSCIQEWLKKSQHCPMCRQNIVALVDQAPTREQDPSNIV
eukprot:Protomagalhaensia_sp_Gyna_25__2028@NODE_208_length_4405_cov_20_746221_g162_i0_p2_GENE_NODE_208_length_4405_cov_20_746221_g162_i0NODE_208_length_4405_cov_20_746221_g162_i0_p2_ORF_typecomplete_len398_score32_47zfRING_2/PF13639_6/1_3e15zfC3HC4_3/PF13920_6/8_3zfC3HC4_3/PF13920_6/8e09zfC3HC4_2/PF13923_6/8_6e09zfANAPC11/PF12861_7/3_9e08zfRING_5/PF14634_6/3_7e08zfrbx1/PF12678_7/2_6e03zfrbx1/PF12678_7/2_2e07zfC3HC4/PF00097_25/1_1e06zfRING_11/PF17123_5/5_9e03zfRING_11/PF17123_5/1_5e06ProkRING_4/PF14447_6